MNINDLMIGDWVKCVESTHTRTALAQIDAIEEGKTSILVRKANVNWFLSSEDIHPAPLTDEILEQNGWQHFGKDNIKPDFHGIEHWIAYKCEAYRMNDNQVLNFRIQSEDYSTQYCGKIQYVHELQHALRIVGVAAEIKL